MKTRFTYLNASTITIAFFSCAAVSILIGQEPLPDIPDTNSVGSFCNRAAPHACGSWAVGGPLCTPNGGTCVSGMSGDFCDVGFGICIGQVCDGKCQNNQTESCTNPNRRTCNPAPGPGGN